MRGKGIVQFFSVALVLVCIYQLTFTFVTNKVEKRADEYANTKVLHGKTVEDATPKNLETRLHTAYSDSLVRAVRKTRDQYLDSLGGESVFSFLWVKDFTYEQCKGQQLNLGLDLQGGMNVVLEVSMEDLVRNLADKNQDPQFTAAIDSARKWQGTNSQKDFVTLFGEAWKRIAPTGRLANIFATRANQKDIKINSTNDEIIAFLETQSKDAFNRTYNILRSRIDKFGVSQPGITPQPSAGRIIVELPGVSNPERVRKLLQASAKLEFWECYENGEILSALSEANKAIASRSVVKDSTQKDSTVKKSILSEDKPAASVDTSKKKDLFAAKADTSKKKKELTEAERSKENPLFSKLNPNLTQDDKGQQQAGVGPVVGYALGKDTSAVNRMLAADYLKGILPRNTKFLWSAKPAGDDKKIYQLYAIRMRQGSEDAPLGGEVITDSRADFDQNGKSEVTMRMDNEGTRIWKQLTTENKGKYIAIVLDNYVYSAPRVENPIENGNSSITGSFTVEEAKDLANILKTGKLPAPARIIAEDVVGPSLGAESIAAGMRSILIAFIAILAFMILYYSNSGIVADIALFFNVFFIIGVLASLGATLTLSGIAGIVLTMGMAVDANVLIHERIKEELAKGKTMVKAIHDGHQKSYSAVFDTHLTTLITGIILAYFGLGPVLGYATTLNIGIILTLFTAVFMAHLVFDWMLKREMNIKFTTFISRKTFSNNNIPFVKYRKYAYIFSGTLALIGLISIFTKGFDYGVDFTGGRSYVVRFDQNVKTNEVRDRLSEKAIFGTQPVVKTFGGNNQLKITTTYLIADQNSTTDSLVNHKLYEGLQTYLPKDLSFEKFKTDYERSSQVVGATISDDIRNHAYEAIIFSLIGIFLYILVRFRRWQFSLGAIVALAHDTLMVIGAYSLLAGIVPFSLELDEQFIAAALTVMGYSVADTVIVFDRIREYLREHPTGDMKKVINDAINATLNRTVITSSTVLLVLLILFIFGGDVIRGFSFAMLLGITFGTYSSIFVATPLVIDLSGKPKENTNTAPSAKAVTKA